jgi:hypothetical protein
MDRLVGEIFGRALAAVIGAGIEGAIRSYSNDNHSTTYDPIPSRSLGPPPAPQQERAVLLSSSSITFGNDCERLVNIAFRTSQSFPSMMSTYGDVIQYLRKELTKHYPNEYFHIIIGDNHAFGFSVDDSLYFAEIEQNLYRVLIFAGKQNPDIKSDTHDADSQIPFAWN